MCPTVGYAPIAASPRTISIWCRSTERSGAKGVTSVQARAPGSGISQGIAHLVVVIASRVQSQVPGQVGARTGVITQRAIGHATITQYNAAVGSQLQRAIARAGPALPNHPLA